jgi:hypothetical protein
MSFDYVFSAQGDDQQHTKKHADISQSSTSTTFPCRDKLLGSNQSPQIREKEDMIAKKLI